MIIVVGSGVALGMADPTITLAVGVATAVLAVATLSIPDFRDRFRLILVASVAAGALVAQLIGTAPWHVAPLAVAGAAVALHAGSREAILAWFRGTVRLSPGDWFLVAASAGGIVLALLGFARADSGRLLLLPEVPLALVVGAMVVNASVEEVVWRGAALDVLRAVGTPAAVAIAIQALSFGLAHIDGYPTGLLGMILATMFGALVGGIRYRSGSLLLPVALHLLADLTILGVHT